MKQVLKTGAMLVLASFVYGGTCYLGMYVTSEIVAKINKKKLAKKEKNNEEN